MQTWKTSLAAALFLLVSACAAAPVAPEIYITPPAPVSAIGILIDASAFCMTVEDATRLTVVMAQEGIPGYDKFMTQSGNECFAFNHGHFSAPVRATVIEKMWAVKTLEGPVLQWWKIEDSKGKTGYTWALEGYFEKDRGQRI